MKEKFDSYDFLNDNGFFNNPEMCIVSASAESHQLETIYKKNTFLRNMCKFEDNVLTPLYFFLFFATMVSLLVLFLFVDWTNRETEKINILIIFMTVAWISFFGWMINTVELNPARIIYLIKGNYLKYILQTVYTLDFNGKIVPLKVIGLSWPCDEEILLVCELKDTAQRYDYDEEWYPREFRIGEIFLHEEAALLTAEKIKIKQKDALSPILGDVSEAFLKSGMFKKYADLYYIKSWFDNPNVTFRNFLMSKESLSAFCKFIDKQQKKEKKTSDKLKKKESAEEKTIDAFMKKHFKSEDGVDL